MVLNGGFRSSFEKEPKPNLQPSPSPTTVLSEKETHIMASALEKIKQLDEQRAKILRQAKEEALTKAHDAINELGELGFDYQLTTRGSSSQGSRKGTRQINPDKPCGYCGFQTVPPHDKRAHRSQDEKAPFNKAELQDLGYTKV